MTQLSEHFSLEELIFSSTAARHGIDNTPSAGIIDHLKLAAAGMEKVRALLGHAIHVDSGFRCPALNAAVGGAKESAHMLGYAVDFICPDFGTPLQIVHAIAASGIEFDKCIQEGTWVHISFDPQLSGQLMTAHFSNGIATYTAGA